MGAAMIELLVGGILLILALPFLPVIFAALFAFGRFALGLALVGVLLYQLF